MHVYRFDPEKFHSAYGIHCQGVELAEGELAPPVATTWCLVKPGEVRAPTSTRSTRLSSSPVAADACGWTTRSASSRPAMPC